MKVDRKLLQRMQNIITVRTIYCMHRPAQEMLASFWGLYILLDKS